MHGPGSIPQDRNPGAGGFTPCSKAFVVSLVPHLAKIGKNKRKLPIYIYTEINQNGLRSDIGTYIFLKIVFNILIYLDRQ